jgi:hypothetical protein
MSSNKASKKSTKSSRESSTSSNSDYESDYEYDDEIDYETYTGSTKNRVVRNHGNYYRGPIGKVRMGKGK